MITSVPGASQYFRGSIIAYSNEVKIEQLKVSAQSIEQYGAVSREVAREMATGVRKILNADFSVAVTGIAGPSGGTGNKPVGTTWIAVASGNEMISNLYHFGEHRERNMRKASITALHLLKKEIERKMSSNIL